MSRRRLPRAARCRKGQLKLKWAALGQDEPELTVAWGEGSPRGAGRMLYSLLSSANYSPSQEKFLPSALEVLEEWGYDMTTLRIEITHKDHSNPRAV